METAEGGGGGGFCTLSVLPPHPARMTIVITASGRKIHRLVSTADLLYFHREHCFAERYFAERISPDFNLRFPVATLVNRLYQGRRAATKILVAPINRSDGITTRRQRRCRKCRYAAAQRRRSQQYVAISEGHNLSVRRRSTR